MRRVLLDGASLRRQRAARNICAVKRFLEQVGKPQKRHSCRRTMRVDDEEIDVGKKVSIDRNERVRA
jgi:hypothetical protein